MKINREVVRMAEKYSVEYLKANLPQNFKYHNIQHTIQVVDNTILLCDALHVKATKKNALCIAAWFHDLGYVVQVDDHERIGADLAGDFLVKQKIDQDQIELVKSLIMATRYPQKAESKMERILCDADMMHLSDKSFLRKSGLLREEWKLTKNRQFSDFDWHKLNYDFLRSHSFLTKFCRKVFEKPKLRNIRLLGDLIDSPIPIEEEPNNLTKKKIRDANMVKGVETLFRNSSHNHMQLSSMADTKAHILLSVSSLIVSIVLSFVLEKLSKSPYLIFPTILLLSVCLITIVAAILTTKPKISKGVFTVDQIRKREVNLLFFGNFYRMEIGMYEWGINELIHDKEYLYNSMTKDVYYLGKVLAVKYRYLNIGYQVFMYGIIGSVLAFMISLMYSDII